VSFLEVTRKQVLHWLKQTIQDTTLTSTEKLRMVEMYLIQYDYSEGDAE
jgi:hypothetical protein